MFATRFITYVIIYVLDRGKMDTYRTIKYFFYMPGIFIVLLALIALYLGISSYYTPKDSKLRKLNCIGSLFCILAAVIFYALTINAVAQRLMNNLEYQYTTVSIKPDAIFVLGGDSSREKTAYRIYKKHKTTVVVSGYNGEAERMQKNLLKFGVPYEHIILEPKSTNTRDHVKYMLPIAQEKDFKNIYLVTNAYHMPRSMMNFETIFKENGIKIYPYSCGYRTPKKHIENKYEWIPNRWSMDLSNHVCNEYLGIMQLKVLKFFRIE